MSREDNVVLTSWPLDEGVLELRIYTAKPLPAAAWPELSVLMNVAASFAKRVRAFNSLADMTQAETPEFRGEGSEPGRGTDISEDAILGETQVMPRVPTDWLLEESNQGPE